jgi:hypothetical protein
VNTKVVFLGAAAGLVLAAVMTSAINGQEPPIDAPYLAVFTVKDSETGSGVPGAYVSIGGASAVTNSQGQATLGLDSPGTYEFTVSASGYAQFSDEFTFTAEDLA